MGSGDDEETQFGETESDEASSADEETDLGETDEDGDSAEDGVTAEDPWASDETVFGMSGEEEAEETAADVLHRRYRLQCPGSAANTLRIADLVLFNPTSTGDCPCAVFIGSFDQAGRLIGGKVMLKPGESLPEYRAVSGAAFIGVACSGGCTGEGCRSELTVSVPVV